MTEVLLSGKRRAASKKAWRTRKLMIQKRILVKHPFGQATKPPVTPMKPLSPPE
jgi:hypothetical protein